MLLVVLGAVLIGGVVGSLLRLEERVNGLGERIRQRFGRDELSDNGADLARARFVQGFVLASLVFCVGPLTILGSFADGLHHDISLLALKSALDGFAALAFAAALGWGVAASVLVVAVFQGALTLLAVATGDVLSSAGVAALTATGGLLLVGVALRLLRVRDVPVIDLLPALAVAPLLTALVSALR